MIESVIHTESLTRDFGAVRALDTLSLNIPGGIVFGLLGPNGAGKTTLIRVLLGLVEPTAGAGTVLGHDIRTDAVAIRNDAGVLLEHTGLYERLTAMQNLEFYGRIWRLDGNKRIERSKELLSRFGLWDRRDDRVGAWSRGMKQKLAIARALLNRPRLIFLDEPTAGLDPVSAAGIREDLSRLVTSDNVTVVLTTHNLNEAERLCAQVAVINHGRLLSIGHPDELRGSTKGRYRIIADGWNESTLTLLRALPAVTEANPAERDILITLAESGPLNPVIALLLQQGIAIGEIRRETASLEETFLKLLEEDHAA